jgi:hypothetical protein
VGSYDTDIRAFARRHVPQMFDAIPLESVNAPRGPVGL